GAGEHLDPDQSRSRAADVGRAAERGEIREHGHADAAGGDHGAVPLTQECGSALGRDRRWQHPSHDERWCHVAERHAGGDQALDADLQHRSGPLRYGDRLRGGEHVAGRRHASAFLAHARRGPDVDRPSTAVRVRLGTNEPTPWPPDLPAAENPPRGAIIDYALAADASGPVKLEILEASGRVIRSYSSDDPVLDPDPAVDPVAYN